MNIESQNIFVTQKRYLKMEIFYPCYTYNRSRWPTISVQVYEYNCRQQVVTNSWSKVGLDPYLRLVCSTS